MDFPWRANDIPESIAEVLRRVETGITLDEAARKAGVHVNRCIRKEPGSKFFSRYHGLKLKPRRGQLVRHSLTCGKDDLFTSWLNIPLSASSRQLPSQP